jgi:hypothetical protein
MAFFAASLARKADSIDLRESIRAAGHAACALQQHAGLTESALVTCPALDAVIAAFQAGLAFQEEPFAAGCNADSALGETSFDAFRAIIFRIAQVTINWAKMTFSVFYEKSVFAFLHAFVVLKYFSVFAG